MSESSMGTAAYGSRSSEDTSNAGTSTTDQISKAADKAKGKLDSAREPIADKLQGAADTLREQATRLPGGEKVAGVARSAADKLESSAGYLQSHNTQEIMQDLMAIVKRHPTQSLLVAGALGFLLARALRSD